MKQYQLSALALCTSILLSACGSGTSSSPAGTQSSGATPGTLLQNPAPRLTSLSAQYFAASLNASAAGQGLLQIAGTPVCGVDTQYIQYGTVDGKGASGATASGALMVPTGTDPKCTGPRPVVLYAHGTTFNHNYNIANWTDSTNPAASEGSLIAAVFAAQGYIVVAPNYVGYDSSNIGYHPYLIEAQQAADMINSLQAARLALPNIINKGVTDSGKLFITGYSQGGYVAMAAQKAMDAKYAAGDKTMKVAAAAPSSGPYALAALFDYVFAGHPNLGGPYLGTMIVTAYQNSYGDIYSNPSDVYTPSLASAGIAALLPYPINSTTAQLSLIPQTALFSATSPGVPGVTPAVTGNPAVDPLFALGFGDPSLFNNTFRLAYLMDASANPDQLNMATWLGGPSTFPSSTTTAATAARKHFAANDLRGYFPVEPTLLCGGANDPTVYFFNSVTMKAEWTAAQPALAPYYPLVDLAAAPTVGDGFDAARGGFQALQNSVYTAAGGGAAGQAAVVQSTHGNEAPFCMAAASGFFSHF